VCAICPGAPADVSRQPLAKLQKDAESLKEQGERLRGLSVALAPQPESGSAEIAGEMAREAASEATASRESGAEAAGECWSEALKSFLDHIPVSSVPGALQPTASPGITTRGTELLPLASCMCR
jgi:hypothetical protein